MLHPKGPRIRVAMYMIDRHTIDQSDEGYLPLLAHGSMTIRTSMTSGIMRGCFSAWWAQAYYELGEGERPDDSIPSVTELENGQESFARYLGADSAQELVHWAAANPDLWGNDFGAEMFTHDAAYLPRGSAITMPTGQVFVDRSLSVNIEDATAHWVRVADRIDERIREIDRAYEENREAAFT